MGTEKQSFASEDNTRFEAVRSSGPGGQNVNRRSTKVHAWVRVGDLLISSDKKKLLRERLAGRINQNDELEVSNDEERSQVMNKERALVRMNELITEAIKIPPKRIPTVVPRGAKAAARRHNELRYEKKKSRQESRMSNLAEDEVNL
mgnify:CR=1 FL=1